MSSRILSKIQEQMEIKNIIWGIRFLFKNQQIDKKYIELLYKVVDSYNLDKKDSEFFFSEMFYEEDYYEQIYLDLKRKNIIMAIELLSKFEALDDKYIDILKDIINNVNEKGYTI